MFSSRTLIEHPRRAEIRPSHQGKKIQTRKRISLRLQGELLFGALQSTFHGFSAHSLALTLVFIQIKTPFFLHVRSFCHWFRNIWNNYAISQSFTWSLYLRMEKPFQSKHRNIHKRDESYHIWDNQFARAWLQASIQYETHWGHTVGNRLKSNENETKSCSQYFHSGRKSNFGLNIACLWTQPFTNIAAEAFWSDKIIRFKGLCVSQRGHFYSLWNPWRAKEMCNVCLISFYPNNADALRAV